ncbi:MAG: DUF4139 domain-containing protein [Opitutales bacterium]|nr:DUF4139 domain-containing protein [Opitutales bacterium]
MKRVFAGFLAVSLVLGNSSFAGSVVDSKLDSVRIYPQSAEVTRLLTVEVPQGESEFKLVDFPNSMNLDTVRFKVIQADSTVLVRDVTGSFRKGDLENHPELVAVREVGKGDQLKVDEIKRAISKIDRRLKFADKILESFADNYGEQDENLPDLDQIEQTWGFYAGIEDDIAPKKQELKEQLEDAEQVLDEWVEKYEELKQKLQQRQQILTVRVESAAAQTAEVELSYVVGNCYWNPVYEARALPSEGKLDLRYQASISQNSGEDWEDVKVSLSTAQPNRSGDVPELYPIRLYEIKPHPRKAMKAQDQDVYELTPLAVQSAPGYEGSATLAGTRLRTEFQSSYSSFEAKLPKPISLESGVEDQKVLIQESSFVADYWTEVVPRINTDAYLMAEVVNPFEMPMLGGSSLLFVDGIMMGRSHVDETPVGEKIELSLGVDELVTVERETGKLDEGNRGFLGKSTKITRQYFTEVTNLRSKIHRVVVKDQVPISEHEKISVKTLAPAEEEVVFEENKGIFSWDLNLESNEIRKLETRFEVSFPEDWQIPLNF